MDKTIIVANWKSNKTTEQANFWLNQIPQSLRNITTEKEIIICPSFTVLPFFKKKIEELSLPFKLGAQNISNLGEGAFTGEVNGKQIREFSDYVIIGHSERREKLKEDSEILEQKVKQANENGLSVIFCIQDKDTFIPQDVEIVAYEPIFAIGSGNPDTPENAEKVASAVGKKTFLYGGSVTSENVGSFTKKDLITGVLVGGASLDPLEFAKIVELA